MLNAAGSHTALGNCALALDHFKLMDAHWQAHQDTFGDTHNVAIVRLVMIGSLEGRPHDLSSLAVGIRLSRQQTTRRCVSLASLGWIENRRQRNHVTVRPTPKLIEYSQRQLDKRLPVVVAKWQRIAAAMVGTVAMLQPAPQPDAAAPTVAPEVAVEQRLSSAEMVRQLGLKSPHPNPFMMWHGL
jgi:hypothetical protein